MRWVAAPPQARPGCLSSVGWCPGAPRCVRVLGTRLVAPYHPSMSRGRLISPFLVDLALLDTAATETTDPDAGGPLTSGIDPIFREPVLVSGGTTPAAPAPSKPRVETMVTVRAQVEDESWEALRMMSLGNSPNSRVVLVFHFRELELANLVDPTTGRALIKVTDRLVAIRRWPTGDLVQSVLTPPGLYCTEAMPRSFGLALIGAHRNLLVCTFEPRDVGVNR